MFAVLGLSLGACAPEEPAAPTPAEAMPTVEAMPTQEAIEPAEESIVLYSGRSEELVGPLIERFEEETGIDVEARWGSTAEMATTLLEEGDNTPADVFYAQDPGGLGAVADLLAPLSEDVLALAPENLRDADGRWVGISGRARAVVYSTAVLTATDLPDDIAGFTDPVWRGRIGWAPSNASFQAMVTAMLHLWGEEETRAWLEGILANEPEAYDGNTPIVEAVGRQEVDVGFVNHYYLHRFLAEQGDSFPARNYFPRAGGPGGLVMVSGAGVLASSDNPTGGEVLLRFLLSPESQTYFAEETYEYPVIDGVEAASVLTPLDELNRPDIDVRDLADSAAAVDLLRDVGALP
jgi:iron(III) transport system substrate-binding protein